MKIYKLTLSGEEYELLKKLVDAYEKYNLFAYVKPNVDEMLNITEGDYDLLWQAIVDAELCSDDTNEESAEDKE